MTLREENIRKELALTQGEDDLIAGAETGVTSQINKTRIFSEIYITKNLRSAINELIQSNEKLSDSNDRYSKAMNLLTFGILIVALVQLIAGIIIPLSR